MEKNGNLILYDLEKLLSDKNKRIIITIIIIIIIIIILERYLVPNLEQSESGEWINEVKGSVRIS